MIEAIIGAIAAIVLGIAANILTPHVEETLKIGRPKNPPLPIEIEEPGESASDEELEAWRAYNRRKLKVFWWQVYVYGASFFAMYMAVFLPLSWSAGLSADAINLSFTRLDVDVILNRERFSTLSALLAILLYTMLVHRPKNSNLSYFTRTEIHFSK